MLLLTIVYRCYNLKNVGKDYKLRKNARKTRKSGTLKNGS